LTIHIASDSYSTPTTDGLIDQVHHYFDAGTAPMEEEDNDACLSRLLVHEWVANLIQHADFSDSEPEIAIRFEKTGDTVCHVIEDNSNGFDLERYLDCNDGVSESFPCRGMGLLMLNACSEHLAYQRIGPHRNRLEFILKDHHGYLDIGV
jgi:serine/threonine-protein kinase RsbW